MAPQASAQSYAFAAQPGGWVRPEGTPWLDVEIGGGMAAAYNHRVRMSADDMPAMHLVDVGSGVNGLGYYMCTAAATRTRGAPPAPDRPARTAAADHGGNNPHSLLHNDAPETTLQESSFQPAGVGPP